MALAGVHIAFGTAGIAVLNGVGETVLLGACIFSQTMANPATSGIIAPTISGTNGIIQPVLSISASAPIYYITGPQAVLPASPNPPIVPCRYYDPSFGREDIFVNAGDLFAWIFA